MATIHGKKIKIFSLNSNPELAEEIADYVGVELSKCQVTRFADGEVQINIDETVRGHSVFIVQSTNKPVNENYMELFIMIDALKRASAKSINVVMPYYGYSRQDRKAASRQPTSVSVSIKSFLILLKYVLWSSSSSNKIAINSLTVHKAPFLSTK